jgi:acyl carrier protein
MVFRFERRLRRRNLFRVEASERERRPPPSATRMTQKEVLDELKVILVERLRFDPLRAAELTLETTLPKGVDGSLGLDSLDFIELSVAIEECFGVVIDETQDLTDDFVSFDSLSRFMLAKTGQG